MSRSKKITVAMLNKPFDDEENNKIAVGIIVAQVGEIIDALDNGEAVNMNIEPAVIGGDETVMVGTLCLGLMKRCCTPAAYKRMLDAVNAFSNLKKE